MQYDVTGLHTLGAGHVRTTLNPEAIRRHVDAVRRIAGEFVRDSGGRLSEAAELMSIAADMEAWIDPQAATWRKFPVVQQAE